MHSWNEGWYLHHMAIWVIVVVLGFLLGAYFWRGGEKPGESPEQVLKRRYANGEIDRETYERMLQDLRK